MIKNCHTCNREFTTYPNWIKRGGGIFCSRKCSKILRDKKVDKICLYCEKSFRIKLSTSIHNASKYCSSKCSQLASRGKSRLSISGDKSPNWRGGIARSGYPSEFNDFLKEEIKKRDDYKCQMCGLQEEEHILIYNQCLSIHHIDYRKINCEHSNLIALCHQCHGRTNYNREYWQDYFLTKKEN